MADSNIANRVEPNLVAEDDPFAELTRIMGHDPRSSSNEASASSQAQDDLALDLESELLGDLAQEDFHNERQAEVVPFRGSAAPAAQETAPVQASEGEDLSDLLTDADFDASFNDAFGNVHEEVQPQASTPVEEPAPAVRCRGFRLRTERAGSGSLRRRLRYGRRVCCRFRCRRSRCRARGFRGASIRFRSCGGFPPGFLKRICSTRSTGIPACCNTRA